MNKLATIFGLLAGIALLLYWGGEAPLWLLRLECLAVMAAALAFGFTSYNPALPGWLRDDAVKGVALVYLGVGVVFTDLRIITSAFIIGNGCRLIAKSASPLVRAVTILTPGQAGKITNREGGGVSRT
jgi:hypothetical protein